MKSLFNLTISALFFTFLFGTTCAQSDRDAWQQPEKIMDNVGIKPGMIIGEAGAGDGYFTYFLSERVGPTGHIYANDILKHRLEHIANKCREEGITNITTILGEVDDPLFPEGELDMVIMMLAFHDFTKPVAWMKNVIPSLKPGAPLVIVDRDPERSKKEPEHFMSKEKVVATMAKTDFELQRIETFLQQDNIYVFKLKDNVNE